MLITLAPWRIKLVRTILGLPALAVGILLAWAGYYHQREDHERVAAWVKTPCRIIKWSVDITRSSFGDHVKPSMAFEYTFAGKTYRSSNYDEATDWIVDLRDFEAEGAAIRRGQAYCYVNPADPAEASYRAARLWYPWSLVGGGALLALGSFIFLVATYWPGRYSRYDPETMSRRVGAKVLFCLALFLLGLGVYQIWNTGAHHILWGQMVRSQLIEIPARVEANGIVDVKGSGRKSHMTYHMAHLVYSYEHDGRRWHSDRWYFDAKRINGGTMDDTRALIARYPRGLEFTCWILPDKPWFSTLDPGLRWDFIWLCIPIGFIFGGLWVLKAWWHMR